MAPSAPAATSGGSPLPEGRYPDQQKAAHRQRRTLAIGLVVVIVAGVLLAYLGYKRFASNEVTGEATGYQIVDESTVSVIINVTRKHPATPVSCIVRARSRDGDEVGRREVFVPAGTAAVTSITTTVKTSKPPGMGDIYGCGTDVPPYLDRTP